MPVCFILRWDGFLESISFSRCFLEAIYLIFTFRCPFQKINGPSRKEHDSRVLVLRPFSLDAIC